MTIKIVVGVKEELFANLRQAARESHLPPRTYVTQLVEAHAATVRLNTLEPPPKVAFRSPRSDRPVLDVDRLK